MNQFLSEPLWLRTIIVILFAFALLFVAIVIGYCIQCLTEAIVPTKKKAPVKQKIGDKFQAVKVTTEDQYNVVIDCLKRNGFRPFEIRAKYRPCYITLERDFMQSATITHYLNGYEILSFDDFIATF